MGVVTTQAQQGLDLKFFRRRYFNFAIRHLTKHCTHRRLSGRDRNNDALPHPSSSGRLVPLSPLNGSTGG